MGMAQPMGRNILLYSSLGCCCLYDAVELVAAGKFDRLVAWSNRKVIDVPIQEAIASYQAVDVNGPLVHTARALGICLGD